MMIALRSPTFAFSTSAAIAKKTFTKFSEKYAANLEAFKSKVGSAKEDSAPIKLSTQKAYVHPYSD